jgi:hypothetical protein
MATFEGINYSLRPNKNIERKVIAEALQLLQTPFRLSSYTYIGLGAIWFVDFILFHRTLGIHNMISMQMGVDQAKRAAYNRPFACVKVREGESTVLLPDLSFNEPVLIWLDYDSTLRGPVLKDLDILGGKLTSGDIVLFTVNADRRQIVQLAKGGKDFRDPKEMLAGLLQVPVATVPDDATEVQGLPRYMASTLFERLRSVVRHESGGELSFVEIFNYVYADQATMITFGGMVVNQEDSERLDQSGILDHPFVTGREQLEIGVPLLTSREKLAIDRLLPRKKPVTEAMLRKLGSGLDPGKVEAYRTFYRYYPTFGELVL